MLGSAGAYIVEGDDVVKMFVPVSRLFLQRIPDGVGLFSKVLLHARVALGFSLGQLTVTFSIVVRRSVILSSSLVIRFIWSE